MKNILRLLAAFFGFALFFQAHAYGPEGHETVGAVADLLIRGKMAETHVRQLLGGDNLTHAATWADRAKASNLHDSEMIAFTSANRDHHQYHYTDIPFQETLYVEGTEGTSTNDIVHIMKQCIEVLQGHDSPSSNPHHFSPRISLLLLSH